MTKVKVFLVDDEKNSRVVVEEYLRARGFDVQSVADGAEALTKGLEMAPNVLVCDWLLPGETSGLDVVRTLLEAHPRLTVLIVTGLPVAQVVRRTSDLSIAAILSKPIGLAALEAAVREARSG